MFLTGFVIANYKAVVQKVRETEAANVIVALSLRCSRTREVRCVARSCRASTYLLLLCRPFLNDNRKARVNKDYVT
ncbi:hypothetical protein SAMN05421736_1073 [Evansella caseinilytica]|uniref:Uncharacterized protein n=1 Tax=Evansella caseinilytica TaxID=1503961 RepID=A0A1H3QQK0_9BACI|nr:hypothetical protein SAMN05421736_1073 [Evansella caseinilytica]